MYQLILVNLSADAHAVLAPGRIPRAGVSAPELRQLLENFSAIDPIENSTADTEIRIVVRGANFLVRSEQGKLVFYDMRQRDLPGQVLSLDQIMDEVDGRAATARNKEIRAARGETPAVVVRRVVELSVDPRWRYILLTLTVALGIANYQFRTRLPDRTPANFTTLSASERDSVQRTLASIYLTGNGPGQHGIVATGPAELKLFELGAVEAPRVVYASYTPGWSGAKICLLTDQPGGVIEIRNDGTLFYCGETYRRIP